jgi:general secretion pathway protein G
MLTVAVAGTLASVAIVNYSGYVEKARVARAIAEIKSISRVLDGLRVGDGGKLPDSLSEVELEHMFDPWGGPYQYLKLEGNLPPGHAGQVVLPAVAAPPAGQGGVGGGPPPKPRKDRFLVPINSDYDLYSRGPDGQSVASLNAKASRDDVVRALDGAFVGVAEDF